MYPRILLPRRRKCVPKCNTDGQWTSESRASRVFPVWSSVCAVWSLLVSLTGKACVVGDVKEPLTQETQRASDELAEVGGRAVLADDAHAVSITPANRRLRQIRETRPLTLPTPSSQLRRRVARGSNPQWHVTSATLREGSTPPTTTPPATPATDRRARGEADRLRACGTR